MSIRAEGRGRINERLLHAYRHQVAYAHPPEGLSEGLSKRVEELYQRMTGQPDAGQRTIAATVVAMSEDEAVEVAKEITALDYQLREELWERRVSSPDMQARLDPCSRLKRLPRRQPDRRRHMLAGSRRCLRETPANALRSAHTSNRDTGSITQFGPYRPAREVHPRRPSGS